MASQWTCNKNDNFHLQQHPSLQLLWTWESFKLWASFYRGTDEGISKYTVHDLHHHLLLRRRTVDFGRNDDGVWRCNKSVLRDGFANFSYWNLGGEGLSMEYHRPKVAIIDVHCNKSQLSVSRTSQQMALTLYTTTTVQKSPYVTLDCTRANELVSG
jgi:hypothetical protein